MTPKVTSFKIYRNIQGSHQLIVHMNCQQYKIIIIIKPKKFLSFKLCECAHKESNFYHSA